MNKCLAFCVLLIQPMIIGMNIENKKKKKPELSAIFMMDESDRLLSEQERQERDILSQQDAFFDALQQQANDIEDAKEPAFKIDIPSLHNKGKKRESVSRVLMLKQGHQLIQKDLSKSEPLPETKEVEVFQDQKKFYRSISDGFKIKHQGCSPYSREGGFLYSSK